MYSMPIVGTSARLYFPNENSEEPIVTGCVRTNGSSCAKTSDTTKRYFGTEHGSEIEMTPGAVNIKGGSKEPLSISFDDNVGVTLTSPKNLNLNADDEIIIKTLQSVKVKAESQIGITKAGTQSGFSVETDIHFKSGNVIKDGSDREAFEPFDDEPKAGTKPEPPEPPKKEKKGFNWGGLLVAAIAVVAVVAAVATFGVGAVLVGAAVGACVGAVCAVASTAISDGVNGTKSSLGTYAKNALKGALTGAVSGAIFGPFGAFSSVGGVMAFGAVNGMADSVLNQAIDGEFSLEQTLFDGLIGAATGGILHGAGKLISKVSPFVTNSMGKVLSKLSSGAKGILSKVSGKADDILNAFNKTSRELFEAVANKVDNVVTSIKNSAQDLVDRAANKFNEVTTKIDNKVDDLLYAGAKRADDFLNVINEVGDKIRKNLGMELQPAGGPAIQTERTTLFEDKVSKMIADRDTDIRVNSSQTNTEKVSDILESAGNDNIDRNISWKDFCRYIDGKGKYSKSVKAQAYYKHTGKMDRIKDIDYGKYLEDYKPKPQSNNGDRWHAHHILYKKGIGAEQQRLAEEGAEILRRNNIDPVLDPDNLVWAQNKAGQHNVTNLQEVVDELRHAETQAIERYGSSNSEKIERAIRKKLIELGKIAGRR